jgi:O-antigen ligase
VNAPTDSTVAERPVAATPVAAKPAPRPRPPLAALAASVLAICGPGAITVYLAFRSGGFFAGAPAIVAVVLGVALMLRVVLADRPFEGFGPALLAAATGLGLYAAWTLASAAWSNAPAQAMIEFDRALMYWLALVLFGSFGWNRERLMWTLRALVAGMLFVAVFGLISRVLPELHPVAGALENSRLSYPLSYWNAVGIFTAVAIVLALGLATRREEPLVSKALAAGAVPLFVATLYFTFSRGAIVALAVGVVAFIVLAARRELIPTILAIAPPTAVVVALCVGTDLLSTASYAGPLGVAEGHTLAWELAGCAVGAALLRVALLPLDRGLDRIQVSRRTRRVGWALAAVAAFGILVGGGAAVHAPSRLAHGYERFSEAHAGAESGELQNRLTSLNNNGRVVQWELAVENFSSHPLLGSGAGTFGQVWAKEGKGHFHVVNAHSLYFEALSNLGVPGVAVLVFGLLALLVGLAWRIRGPDRIVYAALFAAALTWVLHAGYDWDWEMPATGFFLFSLGAMAIAARPGSGSPWIPSAPHRIVRVALGIGCLALVVTPALVALSQGKLDSSVHNLERGDCGAASGEALSAIHTLSVRPEPYQVLGFCDSRAGRDELAISMLRTAIARAPGEWESWYGLALVQAAAGRDPRHAAFKAYRLAPRELVTEEAAEAFNTNDPKKWERRALMAPLPLS